MLSTFVWHVSTHLATGDEGLQSAWVAASGTTLELDQHGLNLVQEAGSIYCRFLERDSEKHALRPGFVYKELIRKGGGLGGSHKGPLIQTFFGVGGSQSQKTPPPSYQQSLAPAAAGEATTVVWWPPPKGVTVMLVEACALEVDKAMLRGVFSGAT